MDPVVGTPKIQDDLVADDFCMFGLLQFFLLDGKDYERFADFLDAFKSEFHGHDHSFGHVGRWSFGHRINP